MNYQGKTIVVTGGSGMIGTHMIKELLKRGADVRTHIHKSPLKIDDDRIEILYDIDLTNIDDCIELIDGADYVIHLAGMIANPKYVPTDFQITLNQITCLTNVIDACQRCEVEKFIDLNSGTGYPLKDYPLKEEEYWDDEPYISYYGYGWMRRYREKVLEHCSHISDMKIYISRTTAVFGPHDNFDLETSHVIPALIKRSLKGENPFVVWGTPDVVRDFIYVEDVINGMLLIMDKGNPMEPYNLGSGESITIGRLVESVLTAGDLKLNVEWDSTKPTTIPFKLADISKITKLGFVPKYTFEQGIKKTIEWYLSE
jgi:GDP-L-fucose synthase